MDRGSGAGEVVDLINFNFERVDDVVADELEVRVAHQVLHILLSAGKKVVHADHLMIVFQQTLAKVTAEKAGSASDQNSHTFVELDSKGGQFVRQRSLWKAESLPKKRVADCRRRLQVSRRRVVPVWLPSIRRSELQLRDGRG